MPTFTLEIDSEWTLAAVANGTETITIPAGTAFYHAIRVDDQRPLPDYQRFEYHAGRTDVSFGLTAGDRLWLATRSSPARTTMDRPAGSGAADEALSVAQDAQERIVALTTQSEQLSGAIAGIAPNVRTTHRQFGYGDNLTLASADDWQTIIEAYDGNGTITLANGTYTATRRLKPRGKPFLRAATLGGATINANWEFLQGTGARFWDINLSPQDETDIWLRATMAYVDFRDVAISAGNVRFTMAQFASCAFSDIRFTASLRDLNIDLGPNVGEGWDFDSNSNVKVAANTTDKRVRLLNRVPAGSQRQFWVFDQGRMICDGLNVLNPLGVVGGIGISARRATTLTFQQSEAAVDGPHNTITGQVRAMILRQNSQASFQGSRITGNDRGIQTQDGGSFSFPEGGLDLSGNTVDHDNINATTGVQVMGVARPTLLAFTSGAATVPAGSTWYLGLAYAGSDLAFARIRIPRKGVLKNLSVRANLGPGTGQTFTVLVYRSSADTPLSVTISDTTTSGEDTTNIVKVNAGDAICIKVVTSAGAAARAFNATVDLE